MSMANSFAAPIPFPANWFRLIGHMPPEPPFPNTPSAQEAASPVFGQQATDKVFVQVVDNQLQEISFSSKEQAEKHLTERGFVNANRTDDPDLWVPASGQPTFFWTSLYDLVRIITLRVIA